MLKPSGSLRVIGYGMARRVRSLVSVKREETGSRDYYQVLRVHPSADASLIEEAYWHLARQYQADIGVDPEAARRLEELNEAYSVLATPGLRESYDESRNALGVGESVETLVRPEPVAVKGDEPKRVTKKPAKVKKELLKVKKERSPGVVRWEMPALQAVVAALGLLVLGAMALWYGAPAFLTLVLAGVALFCTLFPWRFGRIVEMPRPGPERTRDAPQVDASALRESTAAIVARWRQEAGLHPRPPTGPSAPKQGDTQEGSEEPGKPQ